MKNTTFGKGLVVGIVILFFGVASISGIASHINQIPFANGRIVPIHKEMVEITCGLSTTTGIIEIRKEICVEDVKKLSQLMNESREAIRSLQSFNLSTEEINEANQILDTAISELKRFDLLPTTMNLEEVRDFITGAFGEQIYDKHLKKLELETMMIQDQASFDLKTNIACRVFGSGAPMGIFPLSSPFVVLVKIFNKLWDIAIENGLPIFCYIFRKLVEFCNTILMFIGIRPRILIPIGIIYLEPIFQGWNTEPASLSTKGILGSWHIHDLDRIDVFTFGFIGIYGFFGMFGFAPFIIAC